MDIEADEDDHEEDLDLEPDESPFRDDVDVDEDESWMDPMQLMRSVLGMPQSDEVEVTHHRNLPNNPRTFIAIKWPQCYTPSTTSCIGITDISSVFMAYR